MQMMTPLSESELQSLYAWVDDIPLSRSKRNISRDFSDAGEDMSHAASDLI